MPSWMFVNGTSRRELPPFTDPPSSRWNTSGGGDYGTQPCIEPQHGCRPGALVDETCGQIARYFGRFVGWYTMGGYADECGHWHHSGFHYDMWGLSIWNEDEHRLGPERYATWSQAPCAASHAPPPPLHSSVRQMCCSGH